MMMVAMMDQRGHSSSDCMQVGTRVNAKTRPKFRVQFFVPESCGNDLGSELGTWNSEPGH
jgi:hypothetical protein